MESVQLNVRVSKALLYDLEFVAAHIGLEKTDWVRVRLAEIISAEKARIMSRTENEYVRGLLDDEAFEKRMGFPPPKEMKALKQDSKAKSVFLQTSSEEQQRAFVAQMLQMAQGAPTSHYDKYMKTVIKKVEKKRR